jgi:uncharacterized membrane protein
LGAVAESDNGDDLQRRLATLEERLAAVESRLGARTAGPPPPRPPRPPMPVRFPPSPPTPPPAQGKDLESLIGAHWLNRVGIAAVLVGAAYFLKYAFENQWVGPAARVAIGVACGAAILVWSERFHARGHQLFAHSLKVVAVGVLYLSIWAGAETYALVGNGTAFAAMTAVTAVLVGLALRHRSEFIAGLALTGGLLTPVLLSTGTNREVELFVYVALLDAAALVLLALHPWIRLLLVAFVGTLFLYIGWYGSYYTSSQMVRTVLFATLFFLLFAVVPLVRRWGDREGTASVVVLLLAFVNAVIYFAEVSWILGDQPERRAMYAVALAVFFLGMAFALQATRLAAAHVALALGFVTVAIPLQFHSVQITIGWIAEAAALLLLQRTGGRVFRILGSFVLGLAVFRLLFLDHFHTEHLLWNMRALMYAMTIAVFSGIAVAAVRNGAVWRLAVVALNFLALIALTDEVRDYFSHGGLARQFGYSALWMIYGAALMAVGFRRRASFLRWIALVLLGMTVAKVFFYDLSELQRLYRILSFIGLGVLLLAISFAYQKRWIVVDDGDREVR